MASMRTVLLSLIPPSVSSPSPPHARRGGVPVGALRVWNVREARSREFVFYEVMAR